ncbi:hypothetical protein ACFVHQ_04020 [Actinomycetes bacterium NPDC127524]
MKKFRGKRRYFRNLWKSTAVDQYDLYFGYDGWFNVWHTHLDFSGVGNYSLKIRREHINAHIALYQNLLEKLNTLAKPYQSWIQLVEEDPGSDAVYIHTPNPYQNNFPIKIDILNWDCAAPKYIRDLIDLNEFNVGHYNWELNNCYIIQSKYKGLRL